MTESGVDISVIVPTRNRASLLGRLLGQLARIDDDLAYEFVVVDEGSTDATPELLRSITDPRLVIVRHEVPVGLPAARNVGAARSAGRYLAWIDDDDLTSTDRLRRQFEALTATSSRWSCAARVDIDDDLQIIGHRGCPPPVDFDRRILTMNILPAAAQGLLVDRDLATEVGGYDESLRAAEDWEYCIRLSQLSAPHFLDEPLVGYRTGMASMSTDTARMDEAIAAVVERHRHRYRSLDVDPDWASIHQSLLPADLRSSRLRGLARAGRLLRAHPHPRAAARTLAVAAAPRWFEARSARARRDQVPPAWRAQASQWLAQVPAGPTSDSEAVSGPEPAGEAGPGYRAEMGRRRKGRSSSA